MSGATDGSEVATDAWREDSIDDVLAAQAEVRRILGVAVRRAATVDARPMTPSTRWCCIRCGATLVLAVVLFLMFQAVFSWASVPMDAIKAGDASARPAGRGAHARRGRCAACWSTA